MIKKPFGAKLCLLGVLVLSCLSADVGIAGRVEIAHDEGQRNIGGYWRTNASPFFTTGMAVLFEPSGFPCFVREVSVFVDSPSEFRIHILNYEEESLCEVATVAAVEPTSWARHILPGEIATESGGFWVVAEIVNAPEPGIGTSYEPDGGTTKYTKNWDSTYGINHEGYGGNGGNAMIRAVVDVPVEVNSISSLDARNEHIFISFDSPMDQVTLNAETIEIKSHQSGIVPGAYEYDSALMRLEFIPDSLLATGYLNIEVSTGVADIYGNHVALAASNGRMIEDMVDEAPPEAPGGLSLHADDVINVSWQAVPLGDAAGYFLYSGAWTPGMTEEQWLSGAAKIDVGNVVETSVLVSQEELPYRVGISAYDRARNEGEISFEETVVHRGSILLVVESPSMQNLCDQGQDQLGESLQSGAFDCNVWLEWERGGLPDLAYLREFDCVLWTMGQRFSTENAGVMELLSQYMSAGGALFYESRFLLSSNMMGYMFFPAWLHLTYVKSNSDSDAPVVVGTSGDPVGDGTELIYVTKPGASKRHFEPLEDATGFLSVKDKPEEFCALRYEDTVEYGYRLIFSTSILSLVYNTEDRDKLLSRGLCWLEGKDIDFRIASNTRVMSPYSVLELSVSANTLAGVEAEVDAYLAVSVEALDGAAFLYFDGVGFVSEMTPFYSGVHLDSGLFLPRTRVFECLVRDELPSGKYTFYVALTQAGTFDFLTEPRSTVVFMR